MKITIPRVFLAKDASGRASKQHRSLGSPVHVLSSIPRPLLEQNVVSMALLDPPAEGRYLNYKQRFALGHAVQLDYLGQILAGGDFRTVEKPLEQFSVPVRACRAAMDSIFEKCYKDLLRVPNEYKMTYKTAAYECSAGDFNKKCEAFDQCLYDLTYEMVSLHYEMQKKFHTITVLTDCKYAVLAEFLQSGKRPQQDYALPADFPFITTHVGSLLPFEFDYQRLRQQQWPNNAYQKYAMERITKIKHFAPRRLQELDQAFVLLHQPYRQSLDDAIEFLFNLEQMINGYYTFRRMTKIKQRDQSENFYLSLNCTFSGSINRYYSNSQQKVGFLQSLFGKDIFVKQNQEGWQGTNQANGVKLAKYSQYFVNFEQDFVELRACEHYSIRNKLKKINFSEFRFHFFNDQYLRDFSSFYDQQITYYNIQNQDQFTFLPKLAFPPPDEFLDQHYKNHRHQTKTANYKQFWEQLQENSQTFATGVLDVQSMAQFNYHRSNFKIPEDICNLQEMNRDVQRLVNQSPMRGSQFGLLNQISTDIFTRANYSSQVLKRSSAFQNSTFFECDSRALSTQQLNSADISKIEDSSSLSSDNAVSNSRYSLLNADLLADFNFQEKIGTFRMSHINFNHYFYSAINITRFPNVVEIINSFVDFNDKMANLFKISMQEIMRKIVESTYWASVSVSAEKVYAEETKEFVAELVQVIHSNRKLKSISEYYKSNIVRRKFDEILIQDDLFRVEQLKATRLLRIINIEIQDVIIGLARFVCANIIVPFFVQFIGIFYTELFANAICAVLQARSTANLCFAARRTGINTPLRRDSTMGATQSARHVIVLYVLSGAGHILEYLRSLSKRIFVPYKNIELIASYLLTEGNYESARVVQVPEALEAEEYVTTLLNDVADFISRFQAEDPAIVAQYSAFRAKYALQVEGVSFQSFLQKM